MMVRPSASVGYKGKLTNDDPVSELRLIVGSGSLPAYRVPDKTGIFNIAQLSDTL